MPLHTTKFVVSNKRSTLRTFYVEPWGADYTLLPQEEMQIVASSDLAVPWFQIVEWEDSTQVFCEADDYQALQNGQELECGHQRPAESTSE